MPWSAGLSREPMQSTRSPSENWPPGQAYCDFAWPASWDSPHYRGGSPLYHSLEDKLPCYNLVAPQVRGFVILCFQGGVQTQWSGRNTAEGQRAVWHRLLRFLLALLFNYCNWSSLKNGARTLDASQYLVNKNHQKINVTVLTEKSLSKNENKESLRIYIWRQQVLDTQEETNTM